jgi:hypothetical protein
VMLQFCRFHVMLQFCRFHIILKSYGFHVMLQFGAGLSQMAELLVLV